MNPSTKQTDSTDTENTLVVASGNWEEEGWIGSLGLADASSHI